MQFWLFDCLLNISIYIQIFFLFLENNFPNISEMVPFLYHATFCSVYHASQNKTKKGFPPVLTSMITLFKTFLFV